MSLPINIKSLLEQRIVESTRIEYKSAWNPESVLHSICAFANDIDNCGGGYVVLGVEEKDGRPVFPIKGLPPESIDRINKELVNKCSLIEPHYLPVAESVVVDGKDIIVIWIPGGDLRPYKCPVAFPTEKARHWEKAYYIRKMSSTIKAGPQEERELVMMSNRVPFDDRINHHAEVEDLRPVLIADFLHRVGSRLYDDAMTRPLLEVARDMKIVGGTTEYCKPLNVGLMFFNEAPDDFFRYAQIEVVDKPVPTGERMVEKVFRGPLDKQLQEALAYIKNYMLKMEITKVDGQPEAIHTWNIPYKAVEEALSNAVYHRSYEIYEPITVTLTPEKMEILSLPGPDRSITDEDMKRYHFVARKNRNRRIGDFLRELELVEGRNTGIPDILRAMEQNGSPMPVFETDADRSYFLVILPVHSRFIQGKQKNDVPAETRKSVRRNRNSAQIRELALKCLRRGGKMSASELAVKMGYASLNPTVSRILKELIVEGIIKQSHPGSPHSRNQKLSLAEFS